MMAYSIDKIEKLIVDSNKNHIENYEYFRDVIIGESVVSKLKKTWMIVTGKDATSSCFDHQLSTLLLNHYYWRKSNNFGMQYGNLFMVTYVNNSIPNLIEIGVCYDR